METPDDTAITIPQRLVRGFLALVGVCVCYAASIGPVTVLRYQTGSPSLGTFVRFYTPLLLLAYKTSTYDLLDAYELWWRRLCEPKGGYKYDSLGERARGFQNHAPAP